MKVQQFKAANQFILTDDSGNRFFQSYNSIICKIDKTGQIYLDQKYWDYSKTTGKYRNMFLNEGINETRAKIKSEKYILCDLN